MGKGLAGTALGFAIAGLILGWIPFLGWLIWIAGLVLAIVAVVKCKTPEDGKGLAIAALVIMIVSILITGMFMVIGSLAYFGVMSPDRFLPSSFTMSGGFSAGEYRLSEDGTLLFTLINNQGIQVTVNEISVESMPGSDVSCNLQEPRGEVVANGQKMTFSGNCGAADYGDDFRADVKVVYTRGEEAISHMTMGSIMTTVE